ncbi:uncharacterized protein LOC125232819 isoform X2 [Leguminivora glycinivorella]|uniref:uncharacterized protein LOC125232819 isoform X2 n=1 Tax=Leguminivora glycinivorella TaxID=1035111 RepID=UPI00200BF051|nr:uncharacterized protein LOC125232819 isoform X2 [Leguminivora glycinivorella]
MKEICFVLLVTFHYVAAIFEYGEHKAGEVFAFELKDAIQPYIPIHRVNITHGDKDVEEHYTYLKVETETESAPAIHPNIIFDSESNMLTFFIRYPLYTVKFVITGYAMRKDRVTDSDKT